MRAVVLGEVESTTEFFDRVLDDMWIDFDDTESSSETSPPDIVFVYGVSPGIKKQLSQFSNCLICVLGEKGCTSVEADVYISLSTPSRKVVEMIKSAAKSKLKKEQNGVVYSYNACTLQGTTLSSMQGNIELSDVESLILGMLLQHPGKLLRREVILNALGDRTDGSLKKLDVFIYHLRQKVAHTKGGIEIETVQGLGFAIKTPLHLMKDVSEKLEYNGIVFLRDRGQIFCGDTLLNSTALTPSESHVFEMIFKGKGKRYNQERILHEISREIETNQEGKKIVDVYVSHIRRKLGIWRDLISTEFGDGYALDIPNFQKQVIVQEEKHSLYTKAPRILTTRFFEFGNYIELTGETKYRGNYTFYISAEIDGKTTVLKVVQESHPDNTYIYCASGNIYSLEEKISFKEAHRRFAGHTFTPAQKSQYLAFNQDSEDTLLNRCPSSVSHLEDIADVIEILRQPENVGAYIYYARVHSNVEWPRTYIAIERIPDLETPIVISVAVLENRVKKRIKYMSGEDVVSKYGSRRVSKIPTTSIFQNISRELMGKATRTECPPNLVNGVRNISEIVAAFSNPVYFGEYIYAGIIQVPKVSFGKESALNPHLVIVRKGNELTIKIIGGVYYKGEGKTRREVNVLKLTLEDLAELGDLQVKKCIFDANLRKQSLLKGVSVSKQEKQTEESLKVDVEREVSIEEFESAFANNSIAPEYKTLLLKTATEQKSILAYYDANRQVQFTLTDSTGKFEVISKETLVQDVQAKKYRIYRKEVFVSFGEAQNLLQILEIFKNEIYKEGVFLVKYRSRMYPCSVVKKNGKITFSIKNTELSLQDFVQQYGEKLLFFTLKREK